MSGRINGGFCSLGHKKVVVINDLGSTFSTKAGWAEQIHETDNSNEHNRVKKLNWQDFLVTASFGNSCPKVYAA